MRETENADSSGVEIKHDLIPSWQTEGKLIWEAPEKQIQYKWGLSWLPLKPRWSQVLGTQPLSWTEGGNYEKFF